MKLPRRRFLQLAAGAAALPAAEANRGSADFVAPRDDIERQLVQIWAAVFPDVPQISVTASFFELGGDSILSIRVASRLRAAFNVDLSPRAVFTHSTIAQLATAMPTSSTTETSIIPIIPWDGELPLSFAQQRLWFLEEFAPGGSGYVSAFALRLCGELDVDALGVAFTGLVARHESLRTTFEAVEGRGVQVVHPPSVVSLPVVDLSDLVESQRVVELQRVVAVESSRPFDLGRGPLLRVCLVCVGAAEHVLVVALHHIVTDGWSMGVLLRDLQSTLYV